MRSGRSPRWGAVAAVSAVAVVVLVAACGPPRYHYLKNTSAGTFMRVPYEWTLFDEDELLESSEEPEEAKEQFKQLTWSVAFDASPDPSLDHVLSDAEHPTGLVQVRTLVPEQREAFSLENLRSLLLRFDPLSDEAQEGGDVEVVDSRDITRDGGLRGSEMILNLRTSEGDEVTWHQVALVDEELSKIHVLAISCETRCYDTNKDVIETVVASWKVKER